MKTKAKDESEIKTKHKDLMSAPMTEKGKVLEDFVYHFLKNKGYYAILI